ncbi:fibronectin type III domain-containing protein-like [Stylophora pistillata]|uniref:fibronectin type III domain-containing protein-like n=1 Tax=Stylophora pistillata TaxID=50429 RepID=UPI000C0537B2|nr:fibronectin type III domain-containing protein-like [Stylophora pistillata]
MIETALHTIAELISRSLQSCTKVQREKFCVSQSSESRGLSIVFFATEETRITVKPDDKILLERVDIDLRCRAEADSRLELKYYWRRDNAVVQYNSKIEWLEEENVLKISDISVNDAGIYTCVAYTPEPRKSEDQASAKVYVQVVPFPPTNLKINEKTCINRTTVLEWTTVSSDDAPILHFLIEQESNHEPDVFYLLYNETNPNATSVILNLTGWSTLRFRMRAVNSFGPSRPSFSTEPGICRTSQSAPEKFPENLRGVPKGASELDIAWTKMPQVYWNGPGFYYFLEYKKVVETAKEDAPDRWEDTRIPAEASSFKIDNPGYYELWEFRIRAGNNLGPGLFSAIERSRSGQNLPQGQPKDVKVGKIQARSVELSWQPVDAPARGSVDGYRRIALNIFPGPPSDVKVYPFALYILVTWKPPVKPNGIITNYRTGSAKYEGSDPKDTPVKMTELEASKRRYLIGKEVKQEELTNYVVEIQAKTEPGNGASVRILTKTVKVSAPAKPKAPKVKQTAIDKVRVIYNFGIGGGYTHEFLVQFRRKLENEEFVNSSWVNYLNDEFDLEIGGLESALYEFKTIGRNDQGESPPSEITEARPILEKTRITVKPEDKVVPERVNIDLRCRAEADSRLELKYYWKRDEAVVEYNSKIEWLEGENVLKISDISVDDAGIYTCVAYTPEPRKSEDKASAEVNIKGVPFPPTNLKINEKTCINRTTVLEWTTVPSDDAPILHFLIEQESNHEPDVFYLIYNETNPNATSLTLNLTGWSTLRFRMRANISVHNSSWVNYLGDVLDKEIDGLESALYEFRTIGRNDQGESPPSEVTEARPIPGIVTGQRTTTPIYQSAWFIALLVLIAVLLLVLLIFVIYTRHRGSKYPVGKREKKRAAQLIERESFDEEEGPPFNHQREENPPPYQSRGSLDKRDSDRDSLDDYGEGPQFNEDGSFIEEYGDEKKQPPDEKDQSAFATFV